MLKIYNAKPNTFPDSKFKENINYPHNDINPGCSTYQNSAIECLELCVQTLGCMGYSWHSPQHDFFDHCPKGCWLKSKMENGQKESHVISGFVNKTTNKGNIEVCVLCTYTKGMYFK